MNKRQILASLNKIANELDNNGLVKEANTLTNIMIKVAEEENSTVDRAIERFRSSCERIKKSDRTSAEKRSERMLIRNEISKELEGEDLKKFDNAANNIFAD
jgi:hypothetical protein